MADVNMVKGSGGKHLPAQSHPGYVFVETFIDLADVTATKGSAIAQGDVILALAVPAGSVVSFAGVQVIEAMTGSSTDATIDFGITTTNADEYVDGFDLDGAAAGAFATVASTAFDGRFFGVADTLDVLITTQTGTITGGVLRVYAEIADVVGPSRPALAAVGS